MNIHSTHIIETKTFILDAINHSTALKKHYTWEWDHFKFQAHFNMMWH